MVVQWWCSSSITVVVQQWCSGGAIRNKLLYQHTHIASLKSPIRTTSRRVEVRIEVEDWKPVIKILFV